MVGQGILSFYNLKAEGVSKQKEILDMILYVSIGFIIPFFFKRPQELIFLLTNVIIVLAALNISGKKLIPVLIAPILGAIGGAYLFGDVAFVIIPFTPLIFLADLIFVYMIKWLYLGRNYNFFIPLFIGSVAKYLILVISAYAFIMKGLAPDVFLIGFGRIQLILAFLGGMIAYFLFKLKKE